jgi:hypothetical protein
MAIPPNVKNPCRLNFYMGFQIPSGEDFVNNPLKDRLYKPEYKIHREDQA